MTNDYNLEDCTCQKTGVYFERKTEEEIESRVFVPWGHISSLKSWSTRSNAGIGVGVVLIILGIFFMFFLGFYGFIFTLFFVLIGVLAIALGARSECALEFMLDNGEVYKISAVGKRTEASKATKAFSDLFDNMQNRL